MFLKSRNCLDKLNKYIKGTLNNDFASKYDSSTVVPYSAAILLLWSSKLLRNIVWYFTFTLNV